MDDEGGDDILPLLPTFYPGTPLKPYYEKETSSSVRKVLKGFGVGGVSGPVSDRAPRATQAAGGGGEPSKAGTTKDGYLDSLDYNLFASAVNLASLRPTKLLDWRLRSLKRWLLCLSIGICTALLATGIIFATNRLSSFKFSVVDRYISSVEGKASAGHVATAFAIFSAFSVAFATAGAVIVAYLEPLSAGSGIPELKAYINGVNIPRLLRFKTLVAKCLSLPLAMGSGLPVGFEGPMAHLGAAMAAMLSQGKTNFLGCGLAALPSATFRLDSHKREFVCSGAAAGVAAAFNAPAGAVVFIIEEMGAQLWQRGLLWRSFFTATVAAYVIDFLLSGLQNGSWGRLTAQGMFSFGLPDLSEINGDSAWCLYEIPLFGFIGLLGGLTGALFNRVSRRLMELRLAHVAPKRALRVLDVSLLALACSAVVFFVPLYAGECVRNDAVPNSAAAGGSALASSAFFCPPGSNNDLGSLWFSTPEEGIRKLFHEKAGGISPRSLALFWVLYLVLMCLTTGAGVPAGVFIPSLLAGSALGRLVGELARMHAPWGYPFASPGAYAVIGAASMLGGILRLSLSMAIILLEATGNAFFSLPLMVTLMVARFVGDCFSEGLYEVQLQVRQWPVLEERMPKPLCYALRACDVMVAPPLVVPEIDTVGNVLKLLLSCSHSAFPVVFSSAGGAPPAAGGGQQPAAHRAGTLAGYIQRRHLSVLLAEKAFHPSIPSQNATRPSRSPTADGRLRIRVPSVAAGCGESHVLVEDMLLLGSVSPTAQGRRGEHPSWSESVNSSAESSVERTPAKGTEGFFPFPLPPPHPATRGGAGSSASSSTSSLLLGPKPPPQPSTRAISRAQLASRLYTSLQSVRNEAIYLNEPVLHASAFSAHYPRFPDVSTLALSAQERDMYLDLRPYMDCSPVTVHCQAPLERAHKLFLCMGLRHLLVVDDAYNVVGILSRRELTTAFASLHTSQF